MNSNKIRRGLSFSVCKGLPNEIINQKKEEAINMIYATWPSAEEVNEVTSEDPETYHFTFFIDLNERDNTINHLNFREGGEEIMSKV